MGFDPHERARLLVSEARITGISRQDAVWLRSHAADCAECARYEQELEGIVRGFKSFAFDVDLEASDRIQTAISTRFERPRPAMRWVWAAALLVLIASVPVYRGLRDARRDRADALLIEAVNNRVERVVPVAMEPLLQAQSEESK